MTNVDTISSNHHDSVIIQNALKQDEQEQQREEEEQTTRKLDPKKKMKKEHDDDDDKRDIISSSSSSKIVLLKSNFEIDDSMNENQLNGNQQNDNNVGEEEKDDDDDDEIKELRLKLSIPMNSSTNNYNNSNYNNYDDNDNSNNNKSFDYEDTDDKAGLLDYSEAARNERSIQRKQQQQQQQQHVHYQQYPLERQLLLVSTVRPTIPDSSPLNNDTNKSFDYEDTDDTAGLLNHSESAIKARALQHKQQQQQQINEIELIRHHKKQQAITTISNNIHNNNSNNNNNQCIDHDPTIIIVPSSESHPHLIEENINQQQQHRLLSIRKVGNVRVVSFSNPLLLLLRTSFCVQFLSSSFFRYCCPNRIQQFFNQHRVLIPCSNHTNNYQSKNKNTTVITTTSTIIIGPHGFFGPPIVVCIVAIASYHFIIKSIHMHRILTGIVCILFTIITYYHLLCTAYTDPGILLLNPNTITTKYIPTMIPTTSSTTVTTTTTLPPTENNRDLNNANNTTKNPIDEEAHIVGDTNSDIVEVNNTNITPSVQFIPVQQQEEEDRRIIMPPPPPVGYRWCDYCSCYQPPKAMHCRECNVCIANYDHHCVWMGQCIGRKNFISFMRFNISWLCFLCYAVMWISIIAPIITKTYYDKKSSSSS